MKTLTDIKLKIIQMFGNMFYSYFIGIRLCYVLGEFHD